MREMSGLSEAEVWDMPYNRLAGYRACIAEANGWEVVNERQQRILDEIARINAEAAQKAEADNG